MIGTEQGHPSHWRFHSSGFATGSSAEMAVVGRPSRAAAAAAAAASVATAAFVPPPLCHCHGGGGDHLGGGGGTKRPLATCREELERGWQYYHRCVSDDASSSWGDDANVHDDDDDDDDVDVDGVMDEGGSAKKRRRIIAEDAVDATMSDALTFATGRVVRIDRRDPSRRVKSGWYEGPVDAYGNRHGRGITRHDDGTSYEGLYVDDVMTGSRGKYTLATRRELVPDPSPDHDGTTTTTTTTGGLLRVVEVRYEGSFRDDVPHGVGMTITTTVDHASTPEIMSVEVAYDVGVHDMRRTSTVGEGVRVIYRSPSTMDRLIDGGRTMTTTAKWEMSCYRLMHGCDTNLRVADGYAAWIVQCMGATFPGPPPSDAIMSE
jgi:hypothetical protein